MILVKPKKKLNSKTFQKHCFLPTIIGTKAVPSYSDLFFTIF